MTRMKEDNVSWPLRLQVFGRRTAMVWRVDSTISFIRGCLSRCSVNNHDARSYMELDGCDGVLVGAASLNYQQFVGIVDSAYQLATERK